jgi:hypothetical protein
MSDSGLGVQHGFAKRIFVLSVPMIDAVTAFPPAGGFAVAGVFGLSVGLLNSDAEKSSWDVDM